MQLYIGQILYRRAHFVRDPLGRELCSSPWLEMQSFSRCIHFLKVSQYADLGTVIRYWWTADPSACRDWYFHPARNDFNFGNKKKSHGARRAAYRTEFSIRYLYRYKMIDIRYLIWYFQKVQKPVTCMFWLKCILILYTKQFYILQTYSPFVTVGF